MKRSYILRSLPILLAAMLMLTTAAAAGPNKGSLADINPDKPNDATQGRLRVNQCVSGVPQVDIYINGQPAINGGAPQSPLNATGTSGYLYLPAGTYGVSLVRAGGSPNSPFLSNVDVQVVAGHRYTVVVLGQPTDATHNALVIDETAAYAAIGATLPDSQHIGHITVNNIKDAPPVHFFLGGVAQERGVAYGEFEATQWPSYAHGIGVATSSEVLSQEDGIVNNPPGSDNLDCLRGTYPHADTQTSASTTLLNPIDFMGRFNDLSSATGGQTPSLNTFLSVLNTTGLAGMLNTGGPYLLFAPTDNAFAALPTDQRQALMSNPKSLADLVRAHIVEGYYPVGSLGQGGFVDRTVTNMLGERLVLSDDGRGRLTINRVRVEEGEGGNFSMVANGTRFWWINKLLLPASATPASPTAAPTTISASPTAVPTVQIPGTNSRTFSETSKSVSGLFLDYWDKNGGLAQQGFPISNVTGEVSPLDGKPYTVQYFERAVFEYHPENNAPYNVLLSQLGTFQYKSRYPNAAPGQMPNTSSGSVSFQETGHHVGGKFLDYWQKHGGVAQQGFPISDEFTEVSDLNSKPYTVQYFERAVFEMHPENQSPYDVLLSQLGTFRYSEVYQKP